MPDQYFTDSREGRYDTTPPPPQHRETVHLPVSVVGDGYGLVPEGLPKGTRLVPVPDEEYLLNRQLLEVHGLAFGLAHPVDTLKRVLKRGGIVGTDLLYFTANEKTGVCTIVCPTELRQLVTAILRKKTVYTVVSAPLPGIFEAERIRTMEHVVRNGLLLEVRGVAFDLCHPVRTLKRIPPCLRMRLSVGTGWHRSNATPRTSSNRPFLTTCSMVRIRSASKIPGRGADTTV